MDDQERSQTQPRPNRAAPVAAGTPLIHYGATWNAEAEARKPAGEETVAVLVCHGMGQQVRYQTISAVAQAIWQEASDQHGTPAPVEVHLSRENDTFLARAELNWKDKESKNHCVHVYEAYWAPLTEGKVSYWDTIKFLFGAAWNTFRYSVRGGKFQRWMFGGPKTLTVGPWGPFLLAAVLVVLVLHVGLAVYVSLALAQLYKRFTVADLPIGASILDMQAWRDWGHNQQVFLGSTLHVGRSLVIWVVVVGIAYFFRYFIVEFVGDVAAYVSPYKDSKFDELRRNIQKVGLDVGRIIYGFGDDSATLPWYQSIVVVGHSLGSVLAYDTLNALINLDNVSQGTEKHRVVERTRALITFGSPLDKTAFIFRVQANSDQDWIREQLADSVQPLIVSYDKFRPKTFAWVNIWSPMDIISGSLEYYDDPEVQVADQRHVHNMTDPEAHQPLAAHVQYWGNRMLREQLYKYVS
jgi:hypothetical protein